MKVSELWLRSLIHSPLSIETLADQLTDAGIEVDSLVRASDKTKQGIMTLKIPPNRGDCLSMVGVARELAVLNDIPYSPSVISPFNPQSVDTFPIRVEVPELCPKYLGCVIKNVQATLETPAWLKERLELAELNSISVVVDILNYVMLELGQPLHAFDLMKLQGSIVIRCSKKGEKIKLLDNTIRELNEDTLVIADEIAPQAIAGVMGSLDSAVSEKTTNLFIESAYFNPVAVRLSAKHYGLRTDSSFRFERGIDPQLQESAIKRAIQLILEICGGEAGPIIEQKNEGALPKDVVVLLRKAKIKDILGLSLSDEEVIKLLKRSNMTVEVHGDTFKVCVPSYKQDINIEVDLIEEIARIYGYSRLKALPIETSIHFFAMDESKISENRIRALLADRGYSEAITYSFNDPNEIEIFNFKEKPFLLSNPIAANMAAMRVSIWPGLLQAVQYNQRRQQMRVRLFEMGNCFLREKENLVERTVLSGVCAGSLYSEQWGLSSRMPDFYDVKQDIEALFELVGSERTLVFKKGEHPALHPSQTAEIFCGETSIGYLGALNPRIVKALALEGTVFVFELNRMHLMNARIPEFRSLSKFPAIRRDIAVIVNKEVFAKDLESAIVESVGSLMKGVLTQVLVFDVYQGKGIEAGKKSIALGLILQHSSRTLVEGEINDVVSGVLTMLSNRFQAVLRN